MFNFFFKGKIPLEIRLDGRIVESNITVSKGEKLNLRCYLIKAETTTSLTWQTGKANTILQNSTESANLTRVTFLTLIVDEDETLNCCARIWDETYCQQIVVGVITEGK